MSYSRRQLYAMGEPLGESVTRKEGGRIIYGGGGGSGGGQQQTTQVTELPEWAREYAQQTLGLAQGLTTRRELNPATGKYDIVGPAEYQRYTGERTAGFQDLQNRAFAGAGQLAPSGLGITGGERASAATERALGTSYDPFQMGQFTGQTVGQYMNPYLEQAMAPQLREAQRASEMQRQADQARAVGAGAFGGSRQAIVEAERQRNLGQQLGDIRARGYGTAFDQAQQQFAREQQLREQSRQYGAGLGLQGIQTALQGAGILGQLGSQQFGQQREAIGLQGQLGAQQQALEQQRLTEKYQDFLNQQRAPYQQLEFMSNILRGTPMGSVSSLYAPPPSTFGQLAGTAIGAYGASMNKADGGMVDSYAQGGVTDPENVKDILDNLSDAQLEQARQAAVSRGDAEQIQLIAAEMAQRASMRRGIAAGVPDQFADDMEEGMAAGGIVAFANGGIDPQFGGEQSEGTSSNPLSRLRTPSELLFDYIGSKARGGKSIKEYYGEEVIPPSPRKAAPEKPKAEATPAKPAAEEFPLAPQPEPAPKKVPPKARAEVTRAAQDVAKAAGVPEKSMTDEAMDLYRQMQNLRKEDIKKLNEIIESQKGRAEEIKGRGLADALMNFGFTMAAKASKPGATFLGSASEASPVIATTMAENRKAVQAAQDNYNKLRADQAKYELALNTGDVRTAMTTARDIAKDRMDQKRLDQLIAYQNRALNIQAAQANRQPAISQLAEEIMADPSFKGSKMDALNAASGLIGGVGIRTDARLLEKANAEIKESQVLLRARLAAAKTPEERAKVQAEMDADVARIFRRHGIGAGGVSQGSGAAPTTIQRYDAKGNLIQ